MVASYPGVVCWGLREIIKVNYTKYIPDPGIYMVLIVKGPGTCYYLKNKGLL